MLHKNARSLAGSLLALGCLLQLEALQANNAATSYSWHYSYPAQAQPTRYVRYSTSSSTGQIVRRLPSAIVRHQIGNHVTSYQLPPVLPLLEGSRWLSHPYHVPVLHHPPSYFRHRPLTAHHFPAPPRPLAPAQSPPTRISPISPVAASSSNVDPPAAAASPSSSFSPPAEPAANSFSRPSSSSRPVVSPAVAGRPAHAPASRRPFHSSVAPPAPPRTRASPRPAASSGYAPTGAPSNMATVNDADIGFEVTSNSDSASLGGLAPASAGAPARSEPPAASAPASGPISNDDTPLIDPSGF